MMGAGSDLWQYILTGWARFIRYDENHSKAVLVFRNHGEVGGAMC